MKTFHHLGITVRNIERSFAFYSEVLDMSVWDQEAELNVLAPEERRGSVAPDKREFMVFKSPAFEQLTNNPGAEHKYVMLRSADGTLVLQLTEYVSGGADGPRGGHNRVGGLHLSFFVDDVDATWARLHARGGVPIISEVLQITPSMRSFYIEDPDGHPVELLEVSR